MSDSPAQRLSSIYLEDMAYIVLSAIPDDDGGRLDHVLHDDSRTRLRSRLKQLSRYDWPASVAEDSALRRGYTLRQCCRLTVALLLLDACLPPSLAVALARDNEGSFLNAISHRLTDTDRRHAADDDLVAAILPAEIRNATDASDWPDQQTARVRLVRRGDLFYSWSGDLAGPGARLLVDPATSVAALWRWITARRLLDDGARQALLREIECHKDAAGFMPIAGRLLRR